jgi:phage terminase large subunit-like protein
VTSAGLVEREGIRGGVAGLDADIPPWRRWKTKSRAARAIRWIEAYCPIPSGTGTGGLIRLHQFQKDQLEVMLAEGVRIGGLQIPRGNAKSTLWAAVALWALCDDPDAPQVPLVGFNGLSVQTTLWRPIQRMVSMSPDLASRVRVFKSSADRRALCAWNGGELLPMPAHVDRLQGLNPTVALVDEAQTVPPEVWSALIQGAGKRESSLVLAIGTPAPLGQASALAGLRAQSIAGANVAWLEHAALAGCALDDHVEWARANPGIAAGLLRVDQLETELKLVSEAEFRCYRLGQWVDSTTADWLPVGAWDDCPTVVAPPDGTEVVLALAGTWTSSVAVVGATMDGAVFVAWAAETATDDELAAVFATAKDRWTVVEVSVAPRQRSTLLPRLIAAGLTVEVWPNRLDIEVTSSTEWRLAIVGGHFAHDHHPLLAEHVAASVARSTSDGSLKLVPPADGRPVDAARAARMAWARAAVLAVELEAPAIW